MKKRPVAVDLNIIIDPYKMLSIIQGIDKLYSEILIPLPLSYVEIWNLKRRPFTFRLFEDETILGTDLERYFGFTNGITANNFVAGMKLLIMAYQKGMVTILDMKEYKAYTEIGQELFGIKGHFNNIQAIYLPSNEKIFINPDLPVSETLYGMQSNDIISVYGNDEFLHFWHNNGTYDKLPNLARTPYQATISSTLQTLLYKEKINCLSEAFNYVQTNNPFEKLDIELRNTVSDYNKKKDLFFLSLEFLSTTAIDTLINAPIASGSLFAYQFIKKVITKNYD